MKKAFWVIFLSFGLFLVFPHHVFAKRLLPRAGGASSGTASSRAASGSGPVGIKVRFRSDRLAIDADFNNLNSAASVSYMFSYTTRGTTQGASGSINLDQNSTSREIIFGTCSHGVCRYDYGVTNAKFVVTTVLGNGRKLIKTFRLKV